MQTESAIISWTGSAASKMGSGGGNGGNRGELGGGEEGLVLSALPPASTDVSEGGSRRLSCRFAALARFNADAVAKASKQTASGVTISRPSISLFI